MMDRRSFVKVAAGAAASGMFGFGCSNDAVTIEVATGRSLDRIGLQLYTVRTLMETDFAGTLEAVAEAGYSEVEFHSYFGNQPTEVRAILDRLGLDAPANHVSLDRLREDLPAVIEEAKIIGHRYLICPWLVEEERSMDGYRNLAAFLNKAGKTCRDVGLRIGWHNHDFEFASIDDTIPFDLMLDETDRELVDFEIDIFWTLAAGYDPLDYFEHYPGRFSLCHVKDMTAAGEMVDVGAGQVDFAAIFASSDQAGLEHYFVEHDEPADPIASITASHDYLATLTF